jgi:cell division septal protein FtsQ
MRRKRKRTRLRPKPILWLLLTVAICLGVWYSPITSIRNVRVEGALPSDRDRLGSILKALEDIPVARIDPRVTEGKVLENSAVYQAELTRSLFGTALLKVSYRQPVARLLGHPNVLLDADGVLYRTQVPPIDGTPRAKPVGPFIPQIQLPDNGPPTLLTLAGNWQPKTMAKLAQDVVKLRLSDVIRIQVEPGGVVCLNMGTGRVILGSLDDLDKKLAVLRERLATNPSELDQVQELNLTAPESPSFIPKENSRS